MSSQGVSNYMPKSNTSDALYYILCILNIDLGTTVTSKFLKRAELSVNGSEVTIRCEFTDDYPEASCVLVYREYNDPYLTVEEYDRSTEFPVTISVDNTERYTFAVFGKNGIDGFEEEPVITLKNESHVEYPVTSKYNGSERTKLGLKQSMSNTYTHTTCRCAMNYK